ncbi:MAG TPA: RagB/SusD family nutrient uptake outer membrane protein [Prolixibacteraceae bacterium]|nr:RagB/SusD family nutrient uptake outer membrane protein [Prolixibacteraceae bacterium]
MKKIIPIISLLLFLSCNSLFHEEDNKYIVIDKQQEKVDIVNGMYSLLVKVHNQDYFQALLRSDDIENYYNYLNNVIRGSVQIDIPATTTTIYKNLYILIINANSLLPKLSDTEDAALKGEVYFLRAYACFKLARLFGKPPLVTDADVNFLIEKPSFSQVYEFIEKDMLKALELLPDNFLKARIAGETPHKGVAKALLAEVYLAWAGFPINDHSKYAEAARISGEVIQQADEYNMGLVDDIADLWRVRYRHNQENLFGLFFNPEKETQNPYILIETSNNINSGAPQIFSVMGYGDNSRCTYLPEFKFYYNFPLNYRKQCFYPVTTFSGTSLNPLIDPATYLFNMFSYKWHDRDYNSNKKRWGPYTMGSQVTLYLLRYAQTLLTYAEASARSGKLDESAYEAVNRVRRRANKLDIYSPSKFDLPKDLSTEQFIDAVVWERAWELSFEPEGRWFDIVRLNLKDKMPEYRFNFDQPTQVPEKYLTEEWYFYKIPEEDRLINPNFE